MKTFDAVNTLTMRQKEIWQWMLKYQGTWQMPPTNREIGDEFGITQNAVAGHLATLERKGAVIRRGYSTARCCVAVGQRKTCPHCGEELEN